MRRFAVLSLIPGQEPAGAPTERYFAIGMVEADGRLVDAVRELPAGRDLLYVCLDTGHSFTRYRGDCDHRGTLFDLGGLPGIAQTYVRHATVPLVFAAHDAIRAQAALVQGAGVTARVAAEAVAYENPIVLTRRQCLGVIIAALPRLAEPARPVFRGIAVYDAMAYGT